MNDPLSPALHPPVVRPTARFVFSHPAHAMALAFGAGLSPVAPGTVGTLWAWISFVVLQAWLSPAELGALIGLSLGLGWWACTVTAAHMRVLDPGAIVRTALVPGDVLLLCSDGLYRLVPPGVIAETLAAYGPDEAGHRLVALANEGGGTDNISMAIFRRE